MAGFRQTRKWFPSVDNLDKTPLKLHKRRRVHGPKDAKFSEGNLSLPPVVEILYN